MLGWVIVVFILGVIVGVVLGKAVKSIKTNFKSYIERKRVDYFLTRIDYFKPIEKGSYPKEEDV